MTQLGMYSQTQPQRCQPSRGQWTLAGAYNYLAEAYAGYHIDKMYGINVEAGIFLSYIGLFSWYNFDNWAYQPSYVSSNTPFFFNGMRVQLFPTPKLKIEPYVINGWQSYGRFNNRPGFGFQVQYRPTGSLYLVTNGYFLGADTLNNPGRIRYHSDTSFQWMYYQKPGNTLDRMAFSVTGDIGCEHGGGVSCTGNSAQGPKQSFIGYMVYNRFWFLKDRYALTLGGGQINNPGRSLVLLPPIHGTTASSRTPYFPQNPGDPFRPGCLGDDRYSPASTSPSALNLIRLQTCRTSPDRVDAPPGEYGMPGSQWRASHLRKIENRLDTALMVTF